MNIFEELILKHVYNYSRTSTTVSYGAAVVWRRNTELRTCSRSCSGKAISITYCEYAFVALGIQNSMRMRHIVVYGLPRCTIFERNLLNMKCVFRFSLQLLSEPFFILEEMSVISRSVHKSSCKVPVILFRF